MANGTRIGECGCEARVDASGDGKGSRRGSTGMSEMCRGHQRLAIVRAAWRCETAPSDVKQSQRYRSHKWHKMIAYEGEQVISRFAIRTVQKRRKETRLPGSRSLDKSTAPREWVRFTSSTSGEIFHHRISGVISDEIVTRTANLAPAVWALGNLHGSSALGNDVRMTVGVSVTRTTRMTETEKCVSADSEILA
jgi:hypothetical protein